MYFSAAFVFYWWERLCYQDIMFQESGLVIKCCPVYLFVWAVPTKDKNIKISIFMDISVFGFYGYIENISIFINYLKVKDIFNLYIKISLKVYELKTFFFFFFFTVLVFFNFL